MARRSAATNAASSAAKTAKPATVRAVRNALRPVARRDAGEVARELRKVYTAPTFGMIGGEHPGQRKTSGHTHR